MWHDANQATSSNLNSLADGTSLCSDLPLILLGRAGSFHVTALSHFCPITTLMGRDNATLPY